MDAHFRDVLIAAVPVIGGIVVAILVAKITADRTMDLERAKWKRDLYATYIHASDEVRDGVRRTVEGFPESDWPSNIGVAQKALAEIQILSPKMRSAAEPVWETAGSLMKGVIRFDQVPLNHGGMAVPIDRTNYVELDAAYVTARTAFIAAAAKELG